MQSNKLLTSYNYGGNNGQWYLINKGWRHDEEDEDENWKAANTRRVVTIDLQPTTRRDN